MLKEICSALLLADVNIVLVKRVRENIKQKVNLEDQGGGINRRKLIQKVTYNLLLLYWNDFLKKKSKFNFK